MEEEEKKKDSNVKRETEKGNKNSELKKTRIGILGLY
jgi:hypothetical protein